ncbi:MAG: S-layer homology domain-containing protein [Oscillospiraceae bacterium]|nr:S-layer homology domain-containing protein [Oscillospiraceae bacterium]
MKKAISLALSIAMLFTFVATSAKSFSDVKSGDWFYADVSELSDLDIIKGRDGGWFDPHANVTRAEYVAMHNRAFPAAVSTEIKQITFSDVKSGDWFYNDVYKGAKAGLINGRDGGWFDPNAPITRQEAAVVTYNYLEKVGFDFDKGTPASTNDMGKVASWAFKHVAQLVNNGIISGYPEGDFRPLKDITRAESAAIINRAYKKAPKVASPTLAPTAPPVGELEIKDVFGTATMTGVTGFDARFYTQSATYMYYWDANFHARTDIEHTVNGAFIKLELKPPPDRVFEETRRLYDIICDNEYLDDQSFYHGSYSNVVVENIFWDAKENCAMAVIRFGTAGYKMIAVDNMSKNNDAGYYKKWTKAECAYGLDEDFLVTGRLTNGTYIGAGLWDEYGEEEGDFGIYYDWFEETPFGTVARVAAYAGQGMGMVFEEVSGNKIRVCDYGYVDLIDFENDTCETLYSGYENFDTYFDGDHSMSALRNNTYYNLSWHCGKLWVVDLANNKTSSGAHLYPQEKESFIGQKLIVGPNNYVLHYDKETQRFIRLSFSYK